MAKDSPIPFQGASPKDLRVIVEHDDQGYYVASVVELPGCHTQAKTIDGLMERLKEAVDLYIEVEGPPETPSRFVGAFRISL